MLSKSVKAIAKSATAILLVFTAVACSSETKQSSITTAASVQPLASTTPRAAYAIDTPPVTTVFECVQNGPGYATFVKRGERQLSAPLLTWDSKEFGLDYPPEKRCKIVSQKLTDKVSLNGGRLQGLSLAYGKVNDLTVICALTLKEKNCNSDNQLFSLSEVNAKNPSGALLKIFKFSQGNATGADTVPEEGLRPGRIALPNLVPNTAFSDNPPVSKPINPLPNKASDVKTNAVPEEKGF